MDVARSENQDAVQAAARREVVRLEQGLFILEIMVGISPLLGLLGAVSGLVKVFGAFGDAAGQSDPHTIAAGISEALSTTVVGLAIAIPCLVAYSCFVRKVETIASELESLVSLLLTKCYQHKQIRLNEAATRQ
jgi:biopolymer transport protein ExbB